MPLDAVGDSRGSARRKGRRVWQSRCVQIWFAELRPICPSWPDLLELTRSMSCQGAQADPEEISPDDVVCCPAGCLDL